MSQTRTVDSSSDVSEPNEYWLLKNKRYMSTDYEMTLASLGGHMKKHTKGPVENDLQEPNRLLAYSVDTPTGTRFDDHRYDLTCEHLVGKNEARVVQEIGRLIAPCPELLFEDGDHRLAPLAELIDHPW